MDGRDVSLKDYKALQYSRQVLQETYRLTPPVFGTARYLHEPFEVAGATIPPGTMIRLHPLPYLSDPDVWERPLEFIPERWERDATKREAMGSSGQGCPVNANISEHPYLWVVPFSLGKRMCMGARLATVECVSFFSRVLQDYTFELKDNDTPTATFNMGMVSPSNPSPRFKFKRL